MTTTAEQPLELETKADLEAAVSSHERVLVEFYTDGCGICQSMEPVLDGVARASDAVVGVMNPREDPQLVDDYEVTSVPMLLLFVDGELADTRADGFLGVDDVLEFAEE